MMGLRSREDLTQLSLRSLTLLEAHILLEDLETRPALLAPSQPRRMEQKTVAYSLSVRLLTVSDDFLSIRQRRIFDTLLFGSWDSRRLHSA